MTGGIGLTQRQLELLRYIGDFTAAHGYCPSIEEMRASQGLKAKSGIIRMLDGLEERGRIRRLPNRARAIEVLNAAGQRPAPERVKVSVSGPPPKIVRIPLHGRINLNENPREERL